MVSGIELDRYAIEADGFVIEAPLITSGDTGETTSGSGAADKDSFATGTGDSAAAPFSLAIGESCGTGPLTSERPKFKIFMKGYDVKPVQSQITFTLNPMRPPDVLPREIYELVCTQMKYISVQANKTLIEKTALQMSQMSASNDLKPFNFQHALWGDVEEGIIAEYEERIRGRSRSPNTGRKKAQEKGGSMLVSKSQTRGIGAQGQDKDKRLKAASGKDKDPKSRQGGKDAKDSSLERAPSVDSKSSDVAGSGSDADVSNEGTAGERRSRSMGAVAQGRANSTKVGKDGKRVSVQQGGGNTGAWVRRVIVSPGDDGYRAILGSNPAIGRHLSMYKTIPPEVARRVHLSKGSVKGVWLQPHPLQLHPMSFADAFNIAKDRADMSEQKRFEWQMDIVRDFDDKRCAKLETFLSTRRNAVESNAHSASVTHAISTLKAGSGASSKGSSKDIYYRDKGRQPN